MSLMLPSRCRLPARGPVVKNVLRTHLAAAHRLPVICQKPMAPSVPEAVRMVRACQEANVPFFIHENFRWQTPLRELKSVLDEGSVGTPFRGRVELISGFPVFKNQ